MVAKSVEKKWTIGAIDVKAAFLQAPRRTQMTRVTVGEQPSLLKAMHEHGEALYGLLPGDWGQHRDEQLPPTMAAS